LFGITAFPKKLFSASYIENTKERGNENDILFGRMTIFWR